MINIEINIKYRSAVYGFGIRPVSRLRGTSLLKVFVATILTEIINIISTY